jgi:hypothetical protein
MNETSTSKMTINKNLLLNAAQFQMHGFQYKMFIANAWKQVFATVYEIRFFYFYMC